MSAFFIFLNPVFKLPNAKNVLNNQSRYRKTRVVAVAS